MKFSTESVILIVILGLIGYMVYKQSQGGVDIGSSGGDVDTGSTSGGDAPPSEQTDNADLALKYQKPVTTPKGGRIRGARVYVRR